MAETETLDPAATGDIEPATDPAPEGEQPAEGAPEGAPAEGEGTEGAAEGDKPKRVERPKIQTTANDELNELWLVYVKEQGGAANIVLRKLVAAAVGYDLPAEELVPITHTKYENEEQKKAAQKAKAQDRNAELNKALKFYREFMAKHGKAPSMEELAAGSES